MALAQLHHVCVARSFPCLSRVASARHGSCLFPALQQLTPRLLPQSVSYDGLRACKVSQDGPGSYLAGRRCYQTSSLKSRSPRRSLGVRAMSDQVPDELLGGEPAGALPSVGFLGLGIMGTPMADNLLKAGFDVTVWNRTPAKCQPLVNAGAKQSSSPRAVAEACDITFAMLADPAAAWDVATGPDGAIRGLSLGKGYVDVSTVDVGTAQAICAAVSSTGAAYLEAPVSGSKKPAENGSLIFLTAGDRELFERAQPALDVMGKSSFYLGEVGNGAAMKLVVNMVMGSMMAAFSEGLALGQKVGLDSSTILEVISQGAIATPMFSMKGPSMLKGKFAPAFPLKHQQKDMRLAIALGDEVSQALPVAAAANEVYKSGRTAGLGDQDFSAVLAVIQAHRAAQ